MALVDSFKAHNANIRTKHGVKNLELAGGEVGTIPAAVNVGGN